MVVAADKPAEQEGKRVEQPGEPKAAEHRAAEHRAAKPEVPAILGSGTIRPDAIRTILPARVNKDSLAIKVDSNSFSSRR